MLKEGCIDGCVSPGEAVALGIHISRLRVFHLTLVLEPRETGNCTNRIQWRELSYKGGVCVCVCLCLCVSEGVCLCECLCVCACV